MLHNQLNCWSFAMVEGRKAPYFTLEWYSPGKTKKERKASKFVDLTNNNWNESEGTGQYGMDGQGKIEKEN